MVLVVSRHRGEVAEDVAATKNAVSARMNRYLETKATNQTKGKPAEQ